MATHHAHLDDAALMARPTAEIGRLRGRSVMLGAVGLLLTAVGWFQGRDAFMQSYLVAFIFWMGLTVGPLAVMMIHHLTGGAWGMLGRRIWEAAARNVILMAVLFLPIAMNVSHLYVWADPAHAADPVIHDKAAYLNVPFFFFRAALFFVVWAALTFTLSRWSRQQDAAPAVPTGPLDRRSRVLSGPGLALLVLTVTFMAVDWVMSLDPHWYSTIFGVLMLGGQGLSTMAFTILVLTSLMRFKPMADVAKADTLHDLSKLMFAFTLLWAYFSVSQLLIIWSANLPEEIPFYLERLHGHWAPVSMALLLLQFALPFLLLLSRRTKRTPSRVRVIAFIILVMRVVDITWTIGPVFRHDGSGLHWLDFALVLGMGSIWLALFWSNLAKRPLLPAHDPYFKEALSHAGH